MLLHCCCGPCASYVLEHLTPDYNITAFFYNPNIESSQEYEKRKNELLRLLSEAPFAADVEFVECAADNIAFEDAVKLYRNQPEGGARCMICYEMRIRKTAQAAAAGKFDIFTSTMSVSPHKNAKAINEFGKKASNDFGVEYLSADFKKKNGYIRSVELSNQYKLYRQEFCGCGV